MKHIALYILATLLPMTLHAQQARTILDKAAATVSNPGGVEAQFQVISKAFGSTSGTIAIKGNKFHATTPQATVWFDGKTQWTYVNGNDEVNISTPTEAELQAINPYNFINIYKKGFRLTAKTVGGAYEVHLTPTDKKRNIEEMYIIVDQKTCRPTHVKMRQNNKWSTIIISHLKARNIAESTFKFNSADFPHAEIIDLR
jgi:outer membrane lipoprotein-sorting protein